MAGAPEGNQNAVKETRLVTNALRRAVTQGPDKLRAACEKVLEDASNGSLPAFNAIADRLDGKPPQAVSVDGSLTHDVVTEIILTNLTNDSGES